MALNTKLLLLATLAIPLAGCDDWNTGNQTPSPAPTPTPAPNAPDATNWPGLTAYTPLANLPANTYMPEGFYALSGATGTTTITHSNSIGGVNGTYTKPATGAETVTVPFPGAGDTMQFQGNASDTLGSRTLDFSEFYEASPTNDSEFFLGITIDSDAHDYSNLAVWSKDDDMTHGDRLAFGVYGQQTNSADMPASGTASFAGRAIGQEQFVTGNAATYAGFIGDASLSADFAAGTLTGSFTNLDDDYDAADPEAHALTVSQINVNATISGSGFNGTATSVGGSGWSTGSTDGAFYGPGSTAQELGGAFLIEGTSGDGDAIIGSFIADQ